MSQNSNCIYTCIYGNYEYLRNPDYKEPDTDYIVFTDNEKLRSDFWEIRLVPNETDLHPATFHKRMKCQPHIWLSEYDHTIWLDGNLRIIKPNYMEWVKENSPNDSITLYKHFCLAGRHRFCVYKELSESMLCFKYKEDIPKFLQQAEDYDNEGFPQEWGLYQSTFIYRNNRDENICKLNEFWFEQVMKYSNKFPQCQSSLAYSLWKLNIQFDVFKNKKVWDTDDYDIFFHVPENQDPNQKHIYAYKWDGKI